MTIGENIRNKRQEKRLTLEEVAVKANISRQTMSRYETGVISNIPSDKIEAIADALDTSPATLMGWDDVEGIDLLRSLASKCGVLNDTAGLVAEIVNLSADERRSLLNASINILAAIRLGDAVVVDDDGEPITPHEESPQTAPAPPEGKDE